MGRNPIRSKGTMRLPSEASAGLTSSPATSAVTMFAPAGNITFRNGCAWFLSTSFTSVSDLPSEVTSVVTTARSATAASTPLSSKRVHSRARVGFSVGWR